MKKSTKHVMIATSTRLNADAIADAQTKLASAVATANADFNVQYEIAYNPDAPSLAAYAKVGAWLEPLADENFCKAVYLAAIAAGVPKEIAYAAYLACLAS